jgi:hypothetical protein
MVSSLHSPISEDVMNSGTQIARRGVIAAVVGAGLATGVFGVISAEPAGAAATTGVDMQRACTSQYSPSYALKAVVGNQHDAYSWHCVSSGGVPTTYRGIDVNRECVTQNGGGWSAGLGSATNPYSWYCHR